MTRHQNLLLLISIWCGLCASTAFAEVITALTVHDIYFYDRSYARYGLTGDNNDLRVAKAAAGQWQDYGGEKAAGIIFDQDKLQGFTSDQVRNATFRLELEAESAGGTDMGYDIVAIKHDWDELQSTWNARDQGCEIVFGIILNCPEGSENIDWLPDNEVDDNALVVFGDHVYATLDDIGETYGPTQMGVGLIKEWDVTELVKAWANGAEDPAFGMALRNR